MAAKPSAAGLVFPTTSCLRPLCFGGLYLLTPKVHRKALPAPDVSVQFVHQDVVPRTPTEEVVAKTWAEVLGVERVGVHDNFLELGGHSLLARQAIARTRIAFYIDLPLHNLIQGTYFWILGLGHRRHSCDRS